jgi:hypothetical protein
MRAATAAEIAANQAIRNEFETRSKFDADFVGSMLVWTNGLQGKVSGLLKPLYKGTPKAKKLAPCLPPWSGSTTGATPRPTRANSATSKKPTP